MLRRRRNSGAPFVRGIGRCRQTRSVLFVRVTRWLVRELPGENRGSPGPNRASKINKPGPCASTEPAVFIFRAYTRSDSFPNAPPRSATATTQP